MTAKPDPYKCQSCGAELGCRFGKMTICEANAPVVKGKARYSIHCPKCGVVNYRYLTPDGAK